MNKEKYVVDESIAKKNFNEKTKKKLFLIIGCTSFIMFFIIIYVSINFSNYPNKLAPDFEVKKDSIIVKYTQQDRIRLKKSSIKYRIRSFKGEYGDWQDDNEFTNLTESIYFVQTSIVDSNNKYTISNESEVHMYKGELKRINGIEVATISGGIYTIPYYEFEQKHTHIEKCPNSGQKAGVWGDSDLYTCSLCGAKHVAMRTEKKEKYTTWNGQTAYRNVYVYTDHNRTVATTEYNYTYNKDEGVGSLAKTYYSKNEK